MIDKFSYGWLDSSKRGIAETEFPKSADIVFQHNFYDGVTTPQKGSNTYARSGTATYIDSKGSFSSLSANTLGIPEFPFNDTETTGGYYSGGYITNSLTYSEDMSQAAWVAIGTASLSADTITGAATDDGVEQQPSIAAASKEFLFSCVLWVTSGTPTVMIKITDNTESEQGIKSVRLSTTPRRFDVYKKFTSGASGNVKVQIISDSNTIKASFLQLEDRTSGNTDVRRRTTPRRYVPTTTAAATSGSDTYTVPNSIISQCETKGSVSMWVWDTFDNHDFETGGDGTYWISLNAEKLAIIKSANGEVAFWLNSNKVAVASDTVSVAPRRWVHWCITWDTDADQYYIYKNGTQVGSGTTSLSGGGFTTNDLRLGGYSGTAYRFWGDAYFSQVVIWKDALTSAQVSEVYQVKSDDYLPSALGTGKLFDVSLSTSFIPDTGEQDYWYYQDDSIWYFDSTTSIAEATNGVAPIGYPLNGTSKSGLMYSEDLDNQLLQSEAPATTWSVVGSPTVTDSVGSMLTNLTYGTIAGNNTEGIQQSTTIAAASNEIVGSVFASVASGTLSFKIEFEGDSGGTPETQSENHTATTTPQRFDTYASFTASATGNIRMKIILNGTGTLRVAGMQATRAHGSSQNTTYTKSAQDYIPTTTAVAAREPNWLVYTSKNNINTEKGMVIAWICPFEDANDFIGSKGPTVLGLPGHKLFEFYCHFLASTTDQKVKIDFWYGGGFVVQADADYVKYQWTQVGWAWDNSTTPGTFRVLQEGALLNSATATKTTPAERNIWIGKDGGQTFDLSPVDGFHGLIDRVQIYGEYDLATYLSDWNNNKASYGR